MAVIANVFKDPGLTLPFDDATDTLGASAINGSSGDNVFYVGSPTVGIVVQAASTPGIDPIVVSITDATPGVEVDAVDIKLAISSANLDSAIGGASLNLPATINGGAGGAVAVHYRWTNDTGVLTYTDISLDIVDRVESTP